MLKDAYVKQTWVEKKDFSGIKVSQRYTAPWAASEVSSYCGFVNSVKSVFWAEKLANDSSPSYFLRSFAPF